MAFSLLVIRYVINKIATASIYLSQKDKSRGVILLQCILSIFPASMHQFYATILVFVNINPFLYINDQFAL